MAIIISKNGKDAKKIESLFIDKKTICKNTFTIILKQYHFTN
jgi:hypothetical protein